MGGTAQKKQSVMDNLEHAAEKIDPYLKSIREAAPKSSDKDLHYQQDRKRKIWKKGYTIAKEWFSLRQLWYTIPVGILISVFMFDVQYGLVTLTCVLGVLLFIALRYTLGLMVLNDMTDESKKDFFHYYAYTNKRREYEIFSPFLLKGNGFKFKHAFELVKEWSKEIEKKDGMILDMQNSLKRTASESENLPLYVQQEVSFVIELTANLMDKIEKHHLGTLSIESMDFCGHYAIYKVEEERLSLLYCSRAKAPQILKKIDLEEASLAYKSYVKILQSTYTWESDKDSTISFISEADGVNYIYTIILDTRNQQALNSKTESGKMNIERLADAVSASFKLFSTYSNPNKRG